MLDERTANIRSALDALSLEELRAFVSESLAAVAPETRGILADSLVRHAARARSGWKPPPPSAALVDEARRHAADAVRAGEANPSKVDAWLRHAIDASLAGDHASAAAMFGAFLEPMAVGDIHMGEDEMVDEVLAVDVHECVVRYVAAVYATTHITERAAAVWSVLERVGSLASVLDPLAAIEHALGGLAPDAEAFVAAWIELLERQPALESSFSESDAACWRRSAIGRRDGVAGLERLARASRKFHDAAAWCKALVASGDWAGALVANEAAVELVESAHHRGRFLDGAALAAQVLQRRDYVEKLETAWLGAPSPGRLLRWLLSGQPSANELRARARTALASSPTRSPQILSLLDLLIADVDAAAKRLAVGSGLGWSSAEHPGHLVFGAFAWLLGGAPEGSNREEVTAALRQHAFEDELAFDQHDAPVLPKPTAFDALRLADIGRGITKKQRVTMTEAMRSAASHRTAAVLSNKRRRHYSHAASLIGCCVEVCDDAERTARWVDDLRARNHRFPAFQSELRSALARAWRQRQASG